MHLNYANVNDAFDGLVGLFMRGERGECLETRQDSGSMLSRQSVIVKGNAFKKVPSRVGECLQLVDPVIITFDKPEQRVLFNEGRDCNPFFHVFETLWMLAGRNDIEPLEYYSSKIGDFVDDGDGLANGAYGYRWRHAAQSMANPGIPNRFGDGVDQLAIIIDHLKKVPTSRRVVLQMWNVEDDLLKIGPDIQHPPTKCTQCGGTGTKPGTEPIYCQFCSGTGRIKNEWTEKRQSKDVCCNTAVYFLLREEPHGDAESTYPDGVCTTFPEPVTYLDMTVTNRSNDLILGMLGANVVHFSFLQEYIANSLGVQVGKYHQMSNNLHVYTSRFTPDQWMHGETNYHPNYKHVKLVESRERFDAEVQSFVGNNYTEQVNRDWAEPFLDTVAQPMMNAFHCHKQRSYSAALGHVEQIQDTAWRIASENWIKKRANNFVKKGGGDVD